MPFMDIRIEWEDPSDQYWMNPDNLKYCLRKTCPNTNFKIEYLVHPGRQGIEHDELVVDEFHKFTTEDKIPDWALCGGSD